LASGVKTPPGILAVHEPFPVPPVIVPFKGKVVSEQTSKGPSARTNTGGNTSIFPM
jgi:hypothetical protein